MEASNHIKNAVKSWKKAMKDCQKDLSALHTPGESNCTCANMGSCDKMPNNSFMYVKEVLDNFKYIYNFTVKKNETSASCMDKRAKELLLMVATSGVILNSLYCEYHDIKECSTRELTRDMLPQEPQRIDSNDDGHIEADEFDEPTDISNTLKNLVLEMPDDKQTDTRTIAEFDYINPNIDHLDLLNDTELRNLIETVNNEVQT